MKYVLIVDQDSEASHRLADVLAATGHMTRIAPSGLGPVDGLDHLRKPFGICQAISLVNEALDVGPR